MNHNHWLGTGFRSVSCLKRMQPQKPVKRCSLQGEAPRPAWQSVIIREGGGNKVARTQHSSARDLYVHGHAEPGDVSTLGVRPLAP